MTNRRSQHVLLSTAIMLFLFVLTFMLFSDYLFEIPRSKDYENAILEKESVRLANSLVREGYPHNWDIDDGTVQKIGLTSQGVLNTTKIDDLRDNAIADRESYESMKKFLSIQNDYLILFIPLQPLPSITLKNITSPEPQIEREEDLVTHSNVELISVQERLVGVKNDEGRVVPVNMKVFVYR